VQVWVVGTGWCLDVWWRWWRRGSGCACQPVCICVEATRFSGVLVKPSHYWTHIAGPIYFIFHSFLSEPGYVIGPLDFSVVHNFMKSSRQHTTLFDHCISLSVDLWRFCIADPLAIVSIIRLRKYIFD
jgi:hypothetical protein